MSERLKADLALIFCSAIWGATFVVVQEALADASVFAFMAVRFSLAALLMAVVFWRDVRDLDAHDLRAGAQIGLTMFGGYALQMTGLQFTTAAKAGFITGSSVVAVPVLLAVFWKRHVRRWVWLGVAATVLGLYFVTVPSGESLGPRALNKGDFYVAACALVFALHVILVGRFTPHHSIGALSFVQIAVTAALALAALPLVHFTGIDALRFRLTNTLVVGILVTAIGATAIAFSIQVWAQRHTSPTHTAIIFSLEPVFAAATSYLVLGERLGVRGWFGGAMILAGILLAELRGPTQAAPESPGPVTENPPGE
jgi:drug/metabolite transporter (DMT)-like permease